MSRYHPPTSRGRQGSIVTLILACDHVVEYRSPAPVTGQLVFCRDCKDYKEVSKARAIYSARCDSCRYSRQFGQDKERALRLAGRHVQSHSGHSILIYNGIRKVDTIKAEGQSPLPLPLVERTAFVRDHQRSLRDYEATLLPNRNQENT